LVAGASAAPVESALFEQMLGGWRRQQLSRRLGGSLIEGRERPPRRDGPETPPETGLATPPNWQTNAITNHDE
jgi:hypothetical protein